MSRMHDPAHPGEILREDVLPALGLTVSEAARQLGVSRVTLSRLLHGRTGVTPEMALRLAAWLETTPESWLRMQETFDLWRARRRGVPKVQPARRPARA